MLQFSYLKIKIFILTKFLRVGTVSVNIAEKKDFKIARTNPACI